MKVQCHSISNASSSSSYPASMPVRQMLKLGRVIKPAEWEEFNVLNGLAMARNVPFSVGVNSFAEGVFSEPKNSPGVWVLKRYNKKALDAMKQLSAEEAHTREQVQMRTLAENFTNQMKKNEDKEFGDAFSYNTYLDKIQSTSNSNQGFVPMEKYVESNFVKYLNTGNATANTNG